MPKDWDGGVTFPFWLKYGPLGLNVSALQERPQPAPSKELGRAAKRAKERSSSSGASQDSSLALSHSSGSSQGLPSSSSPAGPNPSQPGKRELLQQQVETQQKETNALLATSKLRGSYYVPWF